MNDKDTPKGTIESKSIEYKGGHINYRTYGGDKEFLGTATIPVKDVFNDCHVKLELINTCSSREEAEEKILNDAKKYVDHIIKHKQLPL